MIKKERKKTSPRRRKEEEKRDYLLCDGRKKEALSGYYPIPNISSFLVTWDFSFMEGSLESNVNVPG